MRILKFGGKSLSSAEKTQKICKFIKKIYKNDKKLIIVVSAIGSTTDKLIELSKQYGDGEALKRELAVLLSTGETVSSALFALALNSQNIPAKSLQAFQIQLCTFGEYTNSRVAYINKSAVEKCLNEGYVAVVAGFQGINSDGEISTLGRGGSDTTATALGAIFDTKVEIYSDFDGVFCGDPRKMDYRKIKALDYDSMISMAEGGAKVIDGRSTEIAKSFDIDILSKSSAKPDNAGSVISKIETDIISISTIEHLTKVTIVISLENKMERIAKTAISCLKNVKFYNFTLKNKELSFFVKNSDTLKVVSELSQKLHLLKNKNT